MRAHIVSGGISELAHEDTLLIVGDSIHRNSRIMHNTSSIQSDKRNTHPQTTGARENAFIASDNHVRHRASEWVS